MVDERSANHGGHRRTVKRGAVGILSRGDEYLFVRRAAGLVKGGHWCFPGGHLEPDETSADAVARELHEELGIVVEPTTLLGSVAVVGTEYLLDIWKVIHTSGDLRPNPEEIAEYRWLEPDAIRNATPTLPSNFEVLKMLGH